MEHITLSGHAGAFPMDPEARRQLVSYLAEARAAAGTGTEADETVRDLETTIGDRLGALLDDGLERIDSRTMAGIIADAGPIDVEPSRGAERLSWLYRVEQGKWFGGLCLGLSTRSDLNNDWVRTFAILFLFLTGGLLGVVYLIAMIFVPRVETVEQYRLMLERSGRGHES